MLLKHYGISRPTEAHHKFNEHARVRPVCEKLLSGMDIALVSDAGTPGISDPGFMLVRECAEAGIEVITLPGATAFVPALVDSGLPLDRRRCAGTSDRTEKPPSPARSARYTRRPAAAPYRSWPPGTPTIVFIVEGKDYVGRHGQPEEE